MHYLSDVLGAWAVGITWLGVTAFAFELTRQAAGLPVTDPVTEGLEPEARADLRPAQPEHARRAGPLRDRGRVAAGLVVAWVLILGVLVGLGELVTRYGNGNVLGDHTIPHWFAAHRTPGGDRWSLVFSTLGATQAILIVSLATCVVFLAVTRRWRPVVFIAAVMTGKSLPSSSPPRSSSGPGRTSRTSTSTCRPRPTHPGTRPRPAACMSPWRSWSSATPAAGGGGCS